MKNLKLYHSICFTSLTIVISLLFIQCKEAKRVDPFGLVNDVEQHFGDMEYRQIVIDNPDFNSRATLKAIKSDGQGIVRHTQERAVKYSWYFVIDDAEEIGGFYLGTDKMDTTDPIAMTHDEAKNKLKLCKSKSGNDRKSCLNELVVAALTDCLFALENEEQCKIDCWYRDGECY